MKRTLLLASLFSMAVSPVLHAQSKPPEKEPPPEPPLIASAPANTQWTITYTPRTPDKEPTTPDEIRNRKLRQRYSPVVLAKRVMRSGGQMVVFTTYEAGLKSEGWVVNGELLELPIHEGDIIRGHSIADGDFPEIPWIKAENFRGTVALKGRKAHLYESASDEPNDPSAQAKPGAPGSSPEANPAKAAPPQRAYIDAQSRLPLMVDAGQTVWTYQYAAAPASLPAPDPRIQRIMHDAGSKPAPKNP